MLPLRFAARDLDVNDPVIERGTRQQLAHHLCELRLIPRHANFDFAQSALHALVVPGEKNRTLADKLEPLVDGIAELEAAVLDADDALGRRRKTPIDVEDVA